jgi:TonB family protein
MGRDSRGISVTLLCLLTLPCAWAQRAQGQEQILTLDSKKAARLSLNQPPPKYPALAKVNYLQGLVKVQLLVSREGKVAAAHVLSGNPLLAAAVLSTVRGWLYRPYIIKGISSAFTTRVDINFALRLKREQLHPLQAETDFRRQVKPPAVLARPADGGPSDPSVRVRLLVNEEGKVIDSQLLNGFPAEFERAAQRFERWSFRPARWGTLSVPWYLDVDVPLDHAAPQADSSSPSGH